jgi:toxin FitB
MYLLDTNVISELRRPKPNGAVLAWFESVADIDLHISAVSLGEVQAGIELTRDQDAAKAADIKHWADLVAASYNVLPMDAATFRHWAKLMRRRANTLYEDAMIAATATQHQLTVVTRNVAEFSAFDVQLFNPFESPV